MILISNHLLRIEQFKKLENVVIRINLAHVKDKQELNDFLETEHDVMLDYPKGRTKPPVPCLDISDVVDAINNNSNIKYLAVSNIETASEVEIFTNILPSRVEFVPKIETLNGVLNLKSIVSNKHVNHIMLDSEDLYVDLKNDSNLYLQLKDRVIKTCLENDIDLLELYGVVFRERDK